MQLFNIQVASQLSGVASATIRAWEKRYCAVIPGRGDNGHRLYSEKDIEKLALLFKLTEVGQSIGKIAHLGLGELKDVYTTLMREPYVGKHIVTPHHGKVDFNKIMMNLLLALDSYKVDVISHELEKAIQMTSPRDIALKIIVPLFQKIGIKVDRGELGIAQEHTLSALIIFYLGQMVGSHYQRILQKDELFLFATPEGELHQIGTLAAGLICSHYGFRFIFMGPNIPAESIAEPANAMKAKAIVLGLSGSELHQGASFENYLQDLQGHLSGRTEIWVGGILGNEEQQRLKKRRITYFPTLTAFDEFLSKI